MTRTGDDGSTGLGDGTRLPKDALRVHALGEVDELNATLGVLRAEPLPEEVHADLIAIQHDLFDLGGELSIPGHTLLKSPRVAHLDARLAHYNATLPRLAEFILPAGSRAGALAHVSRTVCRRAERSVVALGHTQPVQPTALQYLNRLSDLLFVLSRVINRADGVAETLWQRQPE